MRRGDRDLKRLERVDAVCMQSELVREMRTVGWAVLSAIEEWWLSLCSRQVNLLVVPCSNAAYIPGWADLVTKFV